MSSGDLTLNEKQAKNATYAEGTYDNESNEYAPTQTLQRQLKNRHGEHTVFFFTFWHAENSRHSRHEQVGYLSFQRLWFPNYSA
jgi:hypothetical protein